MSLKKQQEKLKKHKINGTYWRSAQDTHICDLCSYALGPLQVQTWSMEIRAENCRRE